MRGWYGVTTFDTPLGLRGFPHGDIITRYKLNVTGKASEAEAAMQLMWRVASEKLSAARALQ